MKGKKNKKRLLPGALILLVLGGITALIISISSAYSLPSYEGVTDSYVISEDYAFSPKFINGVTQVEFNYNNISPVVPVTGSVPMYKVTSADVGKVYAIYKNVGKYNGEILDLRITLSGVSGNDAYILFNSNDIGINGRHHTTRKRFTIKYYKHNTTTEVNVKNVLVFHDIDGPTGDNQIEEIGFNNFDKILYYNAYGTHFSKTTEGEWLYFTGTCDYTYNAGPTAACEVEGSNPTPKAGYTIALGSSSTQEMSWRYYYAGINPSPFRIEDPKPIKSVNKTQAAINEEITYEIEQYVPSQSSEKYYSSWQIEDTIPSGVDYVANSVVVKDNTGQTVTNKFSASYNSSTRKLTITAPSTLLSSADFYNNTYEFTFKVKLVNNTSVKSNSARLVNNYTTKTSNTVTTTPKVTVNYQLTGSSQPTDCAPTLPAAETKLFGDAYTKKAPLVASGQEIVCGTKKCSFKGWYTNTALTTTWTDGTALSGNLTLYGSYTCRNKATVTYHVTKYTSPTDGGEYPTAASAGAPTETGNYWIGDPYTQKPKLTDGVYDGKRCKFTGWNTRSDYTGTWTNGSSLTGNLDLYGKWDCDEPVNVTYEVEKYTSPRDGRQYPTAPSTDAPVETTQYYKGDAYTQKAKLVDGVYDGKRCRFTGWNTQNDYTGTWTNGTALTQDLKLYGKWDCDEPIDVTYHVEQYTNTTHPELPNKLPPDSVTPTETGTYYQRDTYTVKPGLITTYDGMICTFDGWWESAAMTGNKTTTKTLSDNLDLYGKWDCKERYTRPEKETDKEILDLDDRFTFTIKNTVPDLSDSEFATYKYRNYKITDTIEDIIEIGNVTVYLNGNNVSRNFRITRDNQTVIVEAKSEYINNIDFYGKTYEIRIVGSIKDYYRENEEDLLEQYKNKTIENKATLTIDNKYSIDSNKVDQEIKRVKINYQIIGYAPPIDVTDPTPGEEEITKGTKYTQKPKLTTRYNDKLCVFDGWYSDEEFTTTWQDGNNLYEDLSLYGSWRCSDLVNEITKSTEEVDTKIGEEYEYTLRNVVPALNESQYYQSYVIEDELEEVVKIDGEDKIEIMSGEENVKDKFNVTIENNKITIAAKDTTSADFYGKEYEIKLKVYVDKTADLSAYRQDSKYVIPNKAQLLIKLNDGEDTVKETPEVEKEFGPVIISYEVIGDGPDIEKTDKVPDDDEIAPGDKYNAKGKLTTRDDSKICTFDGWYQEREFENKYIDGSILEEDMTLYGKWDCNPKEEVIESPDTGKNNIVMIIIGMMLIIGAVFTYFKINKVSN